MTGFQRNSGSGQVKVRARAGRVMLLAAVAAILGPSLVQAACPAGYSGETVAKSVRTLQSDLMVGALSCGQRESYNAFVTEYRGQLVGQGKSLVAHFKSAHGGTHKSKLNSYVTRLANASAIRHATATMDYCQETSDIFNTLLHDGRKSLDSFALRYAVRVNPEVAAQVASIDKGKSCGVGGALASSEEADSPK